MKSRSIYRAVPGHIAAAANAREERGVWVLAVVYPSSSSAKVSVCRVATAEGMPSYAPAGEYEAYWARHDEGYALWVRNVAGDEPVPAPPGRMTVRVPYEGPAPGGTATGVVTVTVSALCPRCGGPRGVDTTPHRFRADGDWYVADVWVNPCGHIDAYDAVLNEAREVAVALERAAAVPVKESPLDPPGDSAAGVVLAAAQDWRSMRAAAAIQVLERHGFTKEADRVRAEIATRPRGGQMSAKQIARFLHDGEAS